MDDGITFEYWSKFHDQYILPLYMSPKTIILLGPRKPNWAALKRKNIKVQLIARWKITEDILSNYKYSVNKSDKRVMKERKGWIVDDGRMDQFQMELLINNIKENYECENVNILWHPVREIHSDSHCLNVPAEVLILCSCFEPAIVVGKASTTLFNVAAYNRSINVASFPSGYPDLDQAAQKQGIAIIDFGGHV